MAKSLISFLLDQPAFKVIRGLLTSPKPRHLRDLASQYELSPAGVSDIIRRLKEAGVLHEQRKGNRRYFRLVLNEQERAHFESLFSIYELNVVRERASRYSRGAADKLADMDEAYSFYKKIKA